MRGTLIKPLAVLTYRDGKSSKAWAVYIDENGQMVTRWGKWNGGWNFTLPQESTPKGGRNPEQAAQRKIDEKRRKGYDDNLPPVVIDPENGDVMREDSLSAAERARIAKSPEQAKAEAERARAREKAREEAKEIEASIAEQEDTPEWFF